MTLQLKADFIPVTVLNIEESSNKKIAEQLDASIAKAPSYFKNAPLLIDLSNVKRTKRGLNIKALCKVLRDKSIIPIGVRGLTEEEHELAYQQGLAVMNQKDKTQDKEQQTSATKEGNKSTDKAIVSQSLSTNVTKIITQPVRAGTQVYAKGGDLIILSSVNAGAECLADGNIHIYGPLRGRALAGAKGNDKARIFCRSLEAELVAIAGYYWVSDEMPKLAQPQNGALMHLFLEGEKLQLAEI